MTWETTTFRRIECIAESPSEALIAVDERLRRMRAQGWQIPGDAAVDLRPSGFGWGARLVLPARHMRDGAWLLRRRVRENLRRASSTRLSAPAAAAAAAPEKARRHR